MHTIRARASLNIEKSRGSNSGNSMTPVDILHELLTHLGNNIESKQYILDSQLHHWPEKVRHALIHQEFIGKTNQAKTITCHGCNRYCNMPVETLQTANNANKMQAIICDKRADMCIVPIEPGRLKQWVLTPQRVAKFLSRSLHVTGTLTLEHDYNRYHLGIMKGHKHSHGICYDSCYAVAS
ncbi:MAG: hypothetical protein GY782_03995 [Gammaproteobacteria bacterium]|nr:hypothetical protein [Gammaproteobacteria bacterium]